MRLLQDENLSRRLVPFLQHDFSGSTHVVLVNKDAIHTALKTQSLASIELIA